MTKSKKRNELAIHDGVEILLTREEEAAQSAYLDSLPKAEQLRLIAEATGVPVVKLLEQIAALNADIASIDNDAYDGLVPFKE